MNMACILIHCCCILRQLDKMYLHVDVSGDSGDQATEAMHAIADAVTQCKFEATDPAADEVVLYKILQVQSQSSQALPLALQVLFVSQC